MILIEKNNFLLEDIYGKQGIVYHRTRELQNIENIKNNGYEIGGGDMYGEGVYFCYDLKSQFNYYMRTYGKYLIKSRINLDKFLIFDYDIAKKVYGKNYTLIDQLKLLKLYKLLNNEKIIKWNKELEDVKFSSNYAYSFSNNSKFKNINIQGYVYTGNHDGKAGVIFEPHLIHPISYFEGFNLNKTKNKNNWIGIKDSKLIHNFNLKLSQSWVKDLSLGNKYDAIYSKEKDGSRRFEINGKYGLLDKNLKIIVKPIYDKILGELEWDNKRIINLNGKEGLIDNNGKILINPIYDGISNVKENGNRLIEIKKNKIYWGLIDINNKEVLEPIYDDIYFSSNNWYVSLRNKDNDLIIGRVNKDFTINYDY